MEQKLRNRCISTQKYFFSEPINTEKQKSSYLLGKHQGSRFQLPRTKEMAQENKPELLCWISSQQHCQNPSGCRVLLLSCPHGRWSIAGRLTPPAWSPESCQVLFIYQLSLGRMHWHPQGASELQVRQEVLRTEVLWQVPGSVLQVLQGRVSSILGPSALCSSGSAPASPWHCLNSA